MGKLRSWQRAVVLAVVLPFAGHLVLAQLPAQQAPQGSTGKTAASGGTSTQSAGSDKAQAYYHYSLGHLYQEQGALYNRPDLLARAIDELKLALQSDPSSTYLSVELADLYAATGRWYNALQEAEDTAKRNPNDQAARQLLGRLYLRLLSGNERAQVPADLPDHAVKTFEEIVRQNPKDISSYLVLARLYRATGDNAKAEATLKKAMELQPDSEDAATTLALLYTDMGDFQSAIDLLKKIAATDPDPQILGTLAYSYEQLHDYKSAADAYSEALKRDPENMGFRKGWGQDLLFSQDYKDALEQFEIAVQADPDDAESYLRMSQIYRAEHQYEQARVSLQKALDLAPDSLDIQYNQVLLLETEGKIPEAISTLQKMLSGITRPDPNTYTAQEKTNRGIFLEKLGFLYRDQENYPEAENTFRQMTELGGDNAVRAQVRLVETYEDEKQYDKALDASAKALQQNPDNHETSITRAYLLASTGDVPAAVNLLKPLLKNTSDDREIWLAIAEVYLRSKQFKDALQASSKAEALSESNDDKAYIYFLNGSIWERDKQYERAEQAFLKSLELDPDSATAMNYLGYMLAERGERLEDAVRYIQHALEIEPNSGAYLDSLGWAYYKQNRLDLAEQYLQKAVERLHADPTVRDHLGDTYFKSGRVREAQEEWRIALREWNRLPKNDVETEDVAKIEKKLKDAQASLSQENKERKP